MNMSVAGSPCVKMTWLPVWFACCSSTANTSKKLVEQPASSFTDVSVSRPKNLATSTRK